jgi:3-methyladenine DNA glycosylase AlkC
VLLIKTLHPQGYRISLIMNAPIPTRKGARTVATIDLKILDQLEAGVIETANLTESLGIDMNKLLLAAAPSIPRNSIDASLGVVHRMAQAGALLRAAKMDLTGHPSDTARGWAAFAIGQDETVEPIKRLTAIRPLAADSHFGVREWAWMAVRAVIVADPKLAIKTLTPWALDKDANVRRFATEATRPRGVWAAVIPLLRQDPSLALPLLNALRYDTEKYVEDSVANWLNDAAKDQPKWVSSLLSKWEKDGVAERLLKRAGRSLRTVRTHDE